MKESDTMQKDKLVYKQMKRYRCKYLAINIVLTALVLFFVIAKIPYIATTFRGETELDTKRFVSETGTVVIDEITELGRKDTKSPGNANFRANSYWQDNIYRYKVEAEEIENTGEGFTQQVTAGSMTETVQLYNVYLAKIEGRWITVLANSYSPVDTVLTGHITEMPKCVKAAVSRYAKEDIEISEYMFDARGTEMDTELSDFVLMWLFVALLVWLWTKLILQYLNPLRTPTYRQLIKYGDVADVEADVNSQAESESAYMEKKKFILEDYILEKDTFKYKITRNHTSKH